MFRIVFLFAIFSILPACSSNTLSSENSAPLEKRQSDKILLSYVRSYLLLGNLIKAEEHFSQLRHTAFTSEALLLSAEINALQNDPIAAQRDFLLAIDDTPQAAIDVSPTLVDYFCTENKWTALDALAASLQTSPAMSPLTIQQINKIGVCYFRHKKWDQAHSLLYVSDNQLEVESFVYLVLARIKVEYKDFSSAQALIAKYEINKTTATPESLWLSYEVYHALQQNKLAEQTGEMLIILFPDTDQAKLYNTVVKFNQIDSNTRAAALTNPVEQTNVEVKYHSIKRGETLYQLSKRYNVAISLLLKWNEQLNINDIPIGTQIQVSENQ